MTFTTPTLSGSTDGQPILVLASGTPGTLIHTAWNDASLHDKLTLTVQNTVTVSGGLNLEWGGTDVNQHLFTYGVPGVRGDGDFLVTWNKAIADGLEVRAYGPHEIVSVSGFKITGEVFRTDRSET